LSEVRNIGEAVSPREGVMAAIRMRTWVEKDERGWFCVCGFWTAKEEKDVGTPGDNPTCPPDDVLRVGPWDTEERAKKELRGRFQEVVAKTIKEMVEKGGQIVALDYAG
jgi:hypothetical protein